MDGPKKEPKFVVKAWEIGNGSTRTDEKPTISCLMEKMMMNYDETTVQCGIPFLDAIP